MTYIIIIVIITRVEPLKRQVQQQRWQLLANRRSMLTLVPVTSLSQLR